MNKSNKDKIKGKNKIILYNIYRMLKYDHKKRNQKVEALFLSREWSYEQYLRFVFILVTFLTGILQLNKVKQKHFATNVQFKTEKLLTGILSSSTASANQYYANKLNSNKLSALPEEKLDAKTPEKTSRDTTNQHQVESSQTGEELIFSESTASPSKHMTTGVTTGRENNQHLVFASLEESTNGISTHNDHQVAFANDLTAEGSNLGAGYKAIGPHQNQIEELASPSEANSENYLCHQSKGEEFASPNSQSSATKKSAKNGKLYEDQKMFPENQKIEALTTGKEKATLSETFLEENFAFSRYAVIEQQSGPLYLITKPLQFYSNLLPIWMIAELFIHLNSRKQSGYFIRRINCWTNDKRVQDVIGIGQIQSQINDIIISLQKRKTNVKIFTEKALNFLQKELYHLLFGREGRSRSPHSQFVLAANTLRLPQFLSSVSAYLKKPDFIGTDTSFNEVAQNYLFVGPSGTGKTLLAKAIAGSAKVNLFCTTLSEIQSSSLTSGSAHLRKLFQQARIYSPSLIILENLELIGQVRKQTTTYLDIQLFTELLVALTPSYSSVPPERSQEATNMKLKSSNKGEKTVETPSANNNKFQSHQNRTPQQQDLLLQIRKNVINPIQQFLWDLKPKSYSGIRVEPNILIGTTHDLKILDPAFIRPGRFNRIIYFTFPNKKDRIRLLKSFTGKSYLSNTSNFDQLGNLFFLDPGKTKKNWSAISGADLGLQNRNTSLEFQSNFSLFPPLNNQREELDFGFSSEIDNNEESREESLPSHRQKQTAIEKKGSKSFSGFTKGKSDSYTTVSTSTKTTKLQKNDLPSYSLSADKILYYFAKQTQGLTHADLHMIVNQSQRELITNFVLSNNDLQWLFIPFSFSRGAQLGVWKDLTNLKFAIFYPQKFKNKNRKKTTQYSHYRNQFSRFPLNPPLFPRFFLKQTLHKVAKHNKIVFSFCLICLLGLSKSIKQISILIKRFNIWKNIIQNKEKEENIQKQSQTKDEDVTTEELCIDPWEHSFYTLRKAFNKLSQN